jgi:hypothetical protein
MQNSNLRVACGSQFSSNSQLQADPTHVSLTQVLQAAHLQQGVQLQLNTVAAVLDQSLERDMHKPDDLRGMSALTRDLLNLWKHCAGIKWAQALESTAAASVAELLIRAQEWQQATEVFEAHASQKVHLCA